MPVELNPAALGQLEHNGAVHLDAALSSGDVSRLKAFCDGIEDGRPGERIRDLKSLTWLLGGGVVGTIARSAIGLQARAVRAILFDKSPANNWTLAWHQDRTIAVAGCLDAPGFDNWNVKAGVHHVEPPFGLIERMVTARIHLDPVDENNAPLLIAPGSHRFGKIIETEIEAVVGQCGELACMARPGDVWLYRTAILHASKRAHGDRRRRVLQVDFSADELPEPLRWAA